MQVRIKTLLLAAGAGLALMAVADTAAAQCAGTCQPPPPPVPPVVPNPCAGGGCGSPAAPPPCCGTGGGVNVNVNVNSVNTNAQTRAYAGGARAGTTVIVGVGGGAYFNVDQPYPTTIQGLNVEGSTLQAIQVPYSESRRLEKRVRIQAVCIDDRARPHPASQVRPGKEILSGYEGEVYRCLAGTRLQWTIVDLEGGHGETIDCAKREALWHGSAGNLQCRPEKQERDCNERSLLRRYGTGYKELVMVREEVFTAYREEVVEASGIVVGGAMMMMDGGVGGRVF